MITGHATRRIGRRGRARALALAALLSRACAPAFLAACAAPPVQPPATPEGLARLAGAVREDVFGRPVSVAPLLAQGAVLYFFRTGCEYCAADLVAAPALAAAQGGPALILISPESPARLRAALRPDARSRLIVVSDQRKEIMLRALPTRFVPRILVVEHGRIRLDATGAGRGGLRSAVALLSGSDR